MHLTHEILKGLETKHALPSALRSDELLVQSIHFRTSLEELDEPAEIIKIEVPASLDVSLLSSNQHQPAIEKKNDERRTVNNLNKLSALE